MKILNKMKFGIALLLIIAMQFIFVPVSEVQAATSPTLTGAASYSVVGDETVTNTGFTTTTGDVGVTAGTDITGFPPGIAGGDNDIHIHSNDQSAIDAQADNLIAFGTLDQDCTTTYAGTKDLVGLNLTPGVYCADAFTLTGTLTLSGSGVWIFKSAATLITSGTANVVGGDPCNVWWRVASSATLGTYTSLIGNILALTSITMDTGATLDGRALAQTGAVTMDTNTITGPTCSAAASSSSSSSSSSGQSNSTPVCTEFIPSSNPDLFQIDRAGSTAVLHFTPVNNNMTYYYIAYGFSPGDERFGVTFPASPSTGAVTYTINSLNPNLTYYFKVRAGNLCAPGGWSNNRESNSKNPLLPNTGMGPRENNTPWYISAGILAGISVLLIFTQRKQRYSSKV